MEERLSDSSASVDEDDCLDLLSESSEDENNNVALLPPQDDLSVPPNLLSDSGSDASDPDNSIKNVSAIREGETSNDPGSSLPDLEEESMGENLVFKSSSGSISPKSRLWRGKHKRRVPAKKNAETKPLGKRRHRKLMEKVRNGQEQNSTKCPVCEKEFISNVRLTVHMRIHKNTPVYRCESCRLYFKGSEELHSHECESNHNICRVCGKAFNTRAGWMQHEQIHTAEKLHECSICGKAFHVKSSLCAHITTHATIRPYNCEFCSKSFAKQHNLRMHTRIHTKERPFECQVCKKSFTQRSNLTTHTRIHSNEHPYSCQWCGKSFAHQSTLKSHGRLHTHEKPYQCEICKKKFSHRGSLKNHQLVHTQEKKFECSYCDVKFAHRQSWSYHEKVHAKAGDLKKKTDFPGRLSLEILSTKS